MTNRKEFIERIAPLNLTKAGQAIALLWFYRRTQTFEERTAEELADDLRNEGLGRPNITNLRKDLKKNDMTAEGKRLGTFQINVKYLDELNKTYGPLVDSKDIKVTSSVLNLELALGTRRYVE